jgi:hypothetical protein
MLHRIAGHSKCEYVFTDYGVHDPSYQWGEAKGSDHVPVLAYESSVSMHVSVAGVGRVDGEPCKWRIACCSSPFPPVIFITVQ